MAMNKYMHPRNIYKSPPNFKQLALDFPEFREFVTQDITGKVSLDFKNTKALRALSCILLKKDFGLNVEMPLDKLIPTIPLRLNYILWLEDLLSLTGKSENIRGVDIGIEIIFYYWTSQSFKKGNMPYLGLSDVQRGRIVALVEQGLFQDNFGRLQILTFQLK